MALILACDDSRTVRQQVVFVLTDEGHEVGEAEDGEQGLERLRHCRYDLIILDMNMPKLDGFGLLTKMRKIDGYENTPVVMLTTENAVAKMKEARDLGAVGWLVKPFQPDRLILAVKKILGQPF
jgi:two-component system chemotaxis response regulator CheY